MLIENRVIDGISKCWSLGYYEPKNRPPGSFSDYVLKFKNGDRKTVDLFSKWVAYSILQIPIHFDLIVRALGSSETVAQENKPLDYLGNFLASVLMNKEGKNVEYLPSYLRKIRPTQSLHTLQTRDQRNSELSGVYCINEGKWRLWGEPNILIIDDVVTAGTTAKAIANVLSNSRNFLWGSNIYLFTLAQTSNDEYATSHNNHIMNTSSPIHNLHILTEIEDLLFRYSRRIDE